MPKKLIEVALPLEAINAESAREYASMYNELQFTDAVNVVFTFR